MALQKVENRVKNQVEDKTDTGIENGSKMGQLRPPNRTNIGAKSLPRGMPNVGSKIKDSGIEGANIGDNYPM